PDPFFPSAPKLDVVPVLPDRASIKPLAWLAPAVPCANQSIAPAGVHEESRAMDSLLASRIQTRSRHAIARSGDVRFDVRCLLMDFGPVFCSIFQENVIELAADHLE